MTSLHGRSAKRWRRLLVSSAERSGLKTRAAGTDGADGGLTALRRRLLGARVQCSVAGRRRASCEGIRAFRPTTVGFAASPPRRVRQMFETRCVTKAANGGGFPCNWLRRVGRSWRSYAQFLVARRPYFSHAFSDEGEVVNNTRHARAPVLLKVFEPDCNLPNAPLERLSQPLCDRVRQQTEGVAHSRGIRAALR
jgi:hypothetical protein